ncbi:MAG: UvrD-helicase domain-containing protein [Ilumatobacteraceae bacterium]
MSTATPFDLSRRPTPGLTVLEASAGTGKTFSLAGLTVLGLARGDVTTRQLCVVTFTEAATAELTGRLRSRLAQAAELLGRWTPGDQVSNDPVDAVLLDGDEAERETRAARLQAALADFDAATISTIHGFCQRLLTAAGADAVEVTGDDEDVVEVVRDHILANGLELGEPDRLVTAVRRRLALPDAAMAEHPSAVPDVRARLDVVIAAVDACVAEVAVRRSRWRRRTFDSMLSDTRDLLVDPVRGPAMVAELRGRFRLVLIDEFQDTDRVQWDIFRTAFLDAAHPSPPAAVVVVGDPKQSIYRFRGAELSAYLAAAEFATDTGGSLHTLDANWRSDGAVLSALEQLFTRPDRTGVTFGDPAVAFHQVRAGRGDDGRCLVDPATDAALRFRVMHPPSSDDGKVAAPAGHDWVRHDVVAEVVRVLSDVRIVRRAGDEPEPTRPSDIGILVRSNAVAEDIADRLRGAGVPVSTSGTDSVLGSAGAFHWTTLIDALQRPTSIAAARALAIGAFGAHDPAGIAMLDEAGDTALLDRLRELLSAVTRGGVPRLVAELRRGGYAQRVLARTGGERLLTDIDHVAELLQRSTGGRPCSPARLAAVLDEFRAVAADSTRGELLDRRLDRDDDTVKVMTVHKSKGLEFPIVLLPGIWASLGGRSDLRHAHDPAAGRRLFDTYWVTGGTSTAKAVRDVAGLAAAEEAGEERRLLYVALTRAVHRLVVWEVPGHSRGTQPWRLLVGDTCGTDFAAVAAASGGAITVDEVHARPSAAAYTPPPAAEGGLDVADFAHDLRTAWRIWSFSGIERAVEHVDVSSVAAPPVEQPPVVIGGSDEPVAADDESLLTVRGSAAFGSLVHGVLEVVDFTSSTLEDDLLAACETALAHGAMAISPEALALGLADAVRAPLGGPLGAIRLADVPVADRLDELEFHLPLAACSALDVARVVADGLPADDPMRPWFAAAADGLLDVDLEGVLTGSIDLVARVGDRYLVADYKTNRISPTATFTDDEMVGEMHRQGYPLQAVLYLVALRRYLRFRHPAADPDEAVVGAAYLFVRGMDPSHPADDPRGVIWWTPPGAVLAELDRLFVGGVSR